MKKDIAWELDIDEEDIHSIHKTITSEIAFYEDVLAKFRMKGVFEWILKSLTHREHFILL